MSGTVPTPMGNVRRDECATDGCHRAATEYFESGGIGSAYCRDCASLVRQIADASPSPADKATDDVRGLVERLNKIEAEYHLDRQVALADAEETGERPDLWPEEVDVPIIVIHQAAAALTSLLERAERAERRAEELADGLMYVTVDHTGCIYTTADEDRAIKLAKDNLAAAIQAERTARERAEARIKELEQALEPFAQALKGNYSHQSDSLLIVAGFNAHDLRFSFQLADFRRARAVKGE